jgi:putative sterol carrier protein
VSAFPSQRWAERLGERLSGEAVTRWRPGALALLVSDDPEQRAVLVELAESEPPAANSVTGQQARERARIVIEGPAAVWEAVLAGQEPPVHALVNGRLRVTGGRLGEVAGHVDGYDALLRAAAALG